MRLYLFIATLIFLFACNAGNGKQADMTINYVPIPVDTNCISPWSDAFFELGRQDFDTIVMAIKEKLNTVLGKKPFDENEFMAMKDSLKKAVFSLETDLNSGDLQIDTTNLLLRKDYFAYYGSGAIKPGNYNWKNMLTQKNLFTFQNSARHEIAYTIHPCIKKILAQISRVKRIRKGTLLPGYAKDSNELIDELNVYKCLLNLSIYIRLTDRSGLFGSKKQFYEVRFIDTAKVFATADLSNDK